MKTVITYGTFDLFHIGHVHMLRRARALGDRLIVGCSTDEFNNRKGKSAIFSYEERFEILQSCRYVDHVIPERNWEQKSSDVINNRVDIFAIGDDWSGKFDFLSDETGCIVTYFPRTPNISTTEVREVIRTLDQDKKYSAILLADRLSTTLRDL